MPDQLLQEWYVRDHPMTSLPGLFIVTKTRSKFHENLVHRTPIDSSVAPPTVIMDIPANNEEVEEVEEEDKEYEIGDSAPLAPPTNEAPNILQPVDGANEKPEGMVKFEKFFEI